MAVQEFFSTGKLLGEINATTIALIPKVSTPSKVSEFRPIACCNVIQKCISKILTNRIQSGLANIVHFNQSAFVPGRHIQDNILIAQELLKGYNRKNRPKRCAMQIDIQKAYDIVSWDFLESILNKFRFHRVMISWIMTCVRFTKFSICINGEIHGYFKGGRGLRQGDPISPYLFTLVMEVFNLIMCKNIQESNEYGYHFGCKDLKLSHICFADDLLVFCKGNVGSIKVVKNTLEEFARTSGLILNLGKSVIFFGSIKDRDKPDMIQILPFKSGKLPVRIQLIVSVLSSMQLYWASVFLLPNSVIKELEKLLKGFLWNSGGSAIGRAKNASIWEVVEDKNDSWGWKTILNIRDKCADGPLSNFITKRVLYDARLDAKTKLSSMINEGQWKWPDGWSEKFSILQGITPPVLQSDKEDDVLWVTNSNLQVDFSTKQIWQDLKYNWPNIDWKDMVWFKHFNPRHAFILWLAVQGKLQTKDRIAKWCHNSVQCVLCKVENETHEHMFFNCKFSADIWLRLRTFRWNMRDYIALQDIIQENVRIKKQNNIGTVVNKIIPAASVYQIWQERNVRIFQEKERNEESICNIIKESVRNQLLSIKVRHTKNVINLGALWKLKWMNCRLVAA
uniref:uncharacterized protein LOC122594653 n=1 Tax=Erigeron canadensis TaxID=72917 RepID=UPI001CB9270B|nr:uncharacterized protein LOC122594653 [Erigeron canadensis]